MGKIMCSYERSYAVLPSSVLEKGRSFFYCLAALECYLRLDVQAARVLENTFRARVLDEGLTPDEPFSHGNLAPGAEAIGGAVLFGSISSGITFLQTGGSG